MKTEILSLGNEIISGVLNGVGQGILLVLLVFLALRCLRGSTNAATRYGIWFATLLLLVLIVPANCLRSYLVAITRSSPSTEMAAFDPSTEPNSSVVPAAQITLDLPAEETLVSSSPSAADSTDSSPPSASENLSAPVVIGSDALSLKPETENQRQLGVTRMPPLAQALVAVASAAEAEAPEPKEDSWIILKQKTRALLGSITQPISWKIVPQTRLWRMAGAALLAVGLIVALARISILLFRLRRIRTLKYTAAAAPVELCHIFENLLTSLSLKRKVALKVSREVNSPVLLGFIHPMIVLPSATTAGDEAVQVLRHELAHVNRWDDWSNLVQHSIGAVLFFHPAVWWVSKQLSLEREIACDDHVLQTGQPRAYARLLADLAGRMLSTSSLPAPGISTHKSQLNERIDMILNTNQDHSPRLARTRLGFVTSAAALLAVAAIYSAPRIVFAEPDETRASAAAPIAAPAADVLPAIAAAPATAAAAEAPDQPALPPPPGTDQIPRAPRPALAPFPPIAGTPAQPFALTAPPAIVTGPVTPMPFVAATLLAPPDVFSTTPRAGRGRTKDASMEERMARLEELVQKLVSQQDRKPGQSDYRPGSPNIVIDRKNLEDIVKNAKQQAEIAKRSADIDRKNMINPKEIERIQELAQREAKVATEQASRAVREAQKAAKADQKRQFNFKFKDGNQLEGLRKKLEALEREKEALDRQIEKLEQQQEQLEQQQEQEEEQEAASEDSNPEACKAVKK